MPQGQWNWRSSKRARGRAVFADRHGGIIPTTSIFYGQLHGAFLCCGLWPMRVLDGVDTRAAEGIAGRAAHLYRRGQLLRRWGRSLRLADHGRPWRSDARAAAIPCWPHGKNSPCPAKSRFAQSSQTTTGRRHAHLRPKAIVWIYDALQPSFDMKGRDRRGSAKGARPI